MKFGANFGVLISVILFSLSFIWIKEALQFISPSMLVMGRVIVALITVSSIALLMGKLQRLTARDAMLFAIIAAAEPVGYFLLESFGVVHVTPTLACIIIAMVPALAPLFAWLINGERVELRAWIGLFMGLCGVGLVAFADGHASLSGQLIGILLLFGAVVTALIYTLMVQRISQRYNSYSIVAWQNIFAVIYLIPVILFLDFDRITSLQFSADWLYPVITLGVLCSSIAFMLYATGLRELGVMRTSLYINLMPGLTAVASFFILSESLPLMKIAGIAIAIAGLYVGLKSRKAAH